MNSNCTIIYPGPSLARCGGSTLSLFMLVLEQFLRTQCDIEDPCDQIIPCATPREEYDFIIVGGGTAGCVVANRLSEVPEWRVLLVEAGPNEPTGSQVPSFASNAQNTSIDWQYRTEPESTAFLNSNGSTIWPRGKVIGGTSVLSNMHYVRGSRRDYDHWEELGCTGWSFQNVLYYFKKSENNLQINYVDKKYHSVGGEQPITQFPFTFPFEKDVIEGARELGEDIGDVNGDSQLRFTICQTFSSNGIRYSSSRAFLRPIQQRENLHVLLNSFVTKILTDNEKKRAIGVEIITENGEKKEYLALKEVIVCAGIIDSPKLLLISGIGEIKTLNDFGIPVVHNLPGVGKNLCDHVSYYQKFKSNQTSKRDLNWAVAFNYLQERDGAMSTTGNSFLGFIQTEYANKSDENPDVKIQIRGYLADCSKTGTICEIDGKVEDGEIPTREIKFRSVLVKPKSKGYITLRDKNPKSPSKIFAGYLSNPSDIKHVVAGVRFLKRLANTDALRKYGLTLDETPVKGCEDLAFDSDCYWKCAVQRETDPVFHQTGTCKMGPESDPEAVVDPQLRVWGMTGLRVVDVSIMPEPSVGSPQASAIMIAEKASDMIKEYHGVLCSI